MKKLKKLFLSKEELLQMKNINLQKELLETQVQREMMRIEHEQQLLVASVHKRLGIDLNKYQVSAKNGEITEVTAPAPATPTK